jgi:hypothetical protein
LEKIVDDTSPASLESLPEVIAMRSASITRLFGSIEVASVYFQFAAVFYLIGAFVYTAILLICVQSPSRAYLLTGTPMTKSAHVSVQQPHVSGTQ